MVVVDASVTIISYKLLAGIYIRIIAIAMQDSFCRIPRHLWKLSCDMFFSLQAEMKVGNVSKDDRIPTIDKQT